MKWLMMILRFFCYSALVIVLSGLLALFLPSAFGLCRNASGGTVSCTDPVYRSIFEYGFTIVLMSIFTGLPGLLALGGLVFGVIDLRRWSKRDVRAQ